MKVIKAGYEILTPIIRDEVLKKIEVIARTCYKSENKITENSASGFVRDKIVRRGHLAMIEHAPTISVRFICDRGISHQIVRNRLASFAQESSRYCNYANEKFGSEVAFIYPIFYEKDENLPRYSRWYAACAMAEQAYFELIKMGATPQEARMVLPNSTKTEIVVTANLREWRTILSQRCTKEADPQIVEIMKPLLIEFQEQLPEIFEDIKVAI